MSAQDLYGSPAAVSTLTRCGAAGYRDLSSVAVDSMKAEMAVGALDLNNDDELEELRIVLADDHPVVREGLKALLKARGLISVVGEASDAEGAVHLVETLKPEVLMLDLTMPTLSAIEAMNLIRRCCPLVRVLVLSDAEDRQYIEEVLRAGAAGYLLKYAAPDDIIMAVRVVASGGVYLDPAIAARLVAPGSQPNGGAAAALSERESMVLRLIARGFSNKEIALRLSLSVKTVETYKARMMDKLGFRSRPEMVAFAAAQGWLSPV
jgi:DNA-binding NarL/FixJ family response regulator